MTGSINRRLAVALTLVAGLLSWLPRRRRARAAPGGFGQLPGATRLFDRTEAPAAARAVTTLSHTVRVRALSRRPHLPTSASYGANQVLIVRPKSADRRV